MAVAVPFHSSLSIATIFFIEGVVYITGEYKKKLLIILKVTRIKVNFNYISFSYINAWNIYITFMCIERIINSGLPST